MIRRLVVCLLPLALLSCDGDAPSPQPEPERPARPGPEPDAPERVVFEQIVVAFKGSYKDATFRSRGEARELAYSVLDRIESGVDFEALKQEYSDDRSQKTGLALGPYYARNHGAKPERLDEVERGKLYPALQHQLFRLDVGEVAIVDYDEKGLATGWHVIKRIK